MEQLSGLIESIVFSSEETGYTVAKLKGEHFKEQTTIVGTLPGLMPGETIHCKGVWKHHPKHGRQFMVASFDLTPPADVEGIQKYLESGLVKGIGPVYAKRIVEHFGVHTLKVIDTTPERLSEISGIGGKRIDFIAKCWDDQQSIRHIMIFLQSHNVPPSFAQKIYKTYGEKSIEKVQENPYALAKNIFRVGFKMADTLAQNLGIAKDSPKRIQAGLEHLLWELSSEGHVCYPKEKLALEAEKMLEIDRDAIIVEIEHLIDEGSVVGSKLPHDNGEIESVWVKPLYLAETGIAREIERIFNSPCLIRDVLVDKALEWTEEKFYIRFAKEQKEAIAQSLEEKVQIITGGPGTGKSTITRAIIAILSKVTDKILLAAPTGRAAKRMTEITGKKAFTIHSLLEIDFQGGGFKRNRDNPLNVNLLIIDEASMIDTQLMYHLLKALPSEARIIFIGDIDQLPSVGPGTVLKDLITSSTLPVIRLNRIFRQGKGSRIVYNAHRINAGSFPYLENDPNSDFLFFEIESPQEILAKTLQLIEHDIPSRFAFNPIDDIQVLSPMKKGVIGTDNINHTLQQKLNPQSSPLHRMGRTFQCCDKVMQVRNNYDKKVFNGDVGRVTSIDMEMQTVTVTFDDKEVNYDFCDLDELMLAYAVSIHKYQGSECPCVIIPVHTSHFKLLFRNLLYTGITRGKKLVVILGTKRALAIAVKADNAHKRFTGLSTSLSQTLCSLSPTPSEG